MGGEEILKRVVEAVARAVDGEKLERELAALGQGQGQTQGRAQGQERGELLERMMLVDLLDEAILSSKAGDKSYPLRLFFTSLGEHVADGDAAFELACGLSVFFRVAMDEEVKMRLGVEVSRLYYRFAAELPLERDLVPQLSPLLAALMSGELQRVRFEAADHARVFDSALHERDAGADGASSQIQAPRSFLCRVVATGMVRARALVKT